MVVGVRVTEMFGNGRFKLGSHCWVSVQLEWSWSCCCCIIILCRYYADSTHSLFNYLLFYQRSGGVAISEAYQLVNITIFYTATASSNIPPSAPPLVFLSISNQKPKQKRSLSVIYLLLRSRAGKREGLFSLFTHSLKLIKTFPLFLWFCLSVSRISPFFFLTMADCNQLNFIFFLWV